jgi:ribonuclease BN (tRNA processing enzyme)
MSKDKQELLPSFWAGDEVQVDPGPPRLFAQRDDKTFAVVLGSGAVAPNPYRNGPAGTVVVNKQPYLIDAGEGVWRGLAKAGFEHGGLLADSLDPTKFTKLFLTHLHSDHTVGLAALIFLPWPYGRSEPLTIYGPIGTKRLVESITDGYQADIDERLHGPEGEAKTRTGWKTIVHEIAEQGQVYEDENVKVEAFHHPHGSFKQNFTYRFTSQDKTIVWSGDGRVSDAFFEASKNADVLFCELTTVDHLSNAIWGGSSFEQKQKIIWSYHMKPKELAQFASDAKVKKVVLIHECNYSVPYENEALLEELKRDYSGEAYSSRDADVF